MTKILIQQMVFQRQELCWYLREKQTKTLHHAGRRFFCCPHGSLGRGGCRGFGPLGRDCRPA